MGYQVTNIEKDGTSIIQITADAKSKLSTSDMKTIVDYIEQNEAVLLRGFDFEGGSDFKDFSSATGESFKPYAGGAFERKTVNGDSTVLEVSGGKTSLVPLHSEMYYSLIRPNRLWFYCEVAPLTDGETLVCNGQAFYQGLSERTKQRLETNNISYIISYSAEEWQAIFQTDNLSDVQVHCDESGLVLSIKDDGSIETTFTTSPLVKNDKGNTLYMNNILPVLGQEYVLGNKSRIVRWENGEKISDDMFKELLKVSNNLAYAHKWKASDLLVVNNNKVMHGRTEITDQNRQILVRLGYRNSLSEERPLEEYA